MENISVVNLVRMSSHGSVNHACFMKVINHAATLLTVTQ